MCLSSDTADLLWVGDDQRDGSEAASPPWWGLSGAMIQGRAGLPESPPRDHGQALLACFIFLCFIFKVCSLCEMTNPEG